MSIFRVEAEISRPGPPRDFLPAGSFIVDTGSEVTWVKQETLREAGVSVEKPGQRFLMADGQTITRDIRFAVIRSGEFQTVDEVVFGQAGDLQLLGARTIEGFNAVVEPTRRQLVAAGPIITAGQAHLPDT